jgi:hypothetical protein
MLALRDRGETPCLHVAQLIEEHATDLAERFSALEAIERLARRLREAPTAEGNNEVCHRDREAAGRVARPRLTLLC